MIASTTQPLPCSDYPKLQRFKRASAHWTVTAQSNGLMQSASPQSRSATVPKWLSLAAMSSSGRNSSRVRRESLKVRALQQLNQASSCSALLPTLMRKAGSSVYKVRLLIVAFI